MSIRVLVVDDEALIRSGIAMLLEPLVDLDVVGEAPDGASAVAQAEALRPDVVVTDLRMPGLSGIDVAAQLCSGETPTAVLLLTTFGEDPDVRAALLAGASGYLLKQTAPRDLAEAVRRVAAGDTWLDPGVAGPRGGRAALCPARRLDAAGSPRPADRPRARGPRADGAGSQQHRDRDPSLGRRRHRQDARLTHSAQDRLP